MGVPSDVPSDVLSNTSGLMIATMAQQAKITTNHLMHIFAQKSTFKMRIIQVEVVERLLEEEDLDVDRQQQI